MSRIRATSSDLYTEILITLRHHRVSPIEGITALTEAVYHFCEELDSVLGTPDEYERTIDLFIEAIHTYDEYGQTKEKSQEDCEGHKE